MEKLNIIKEGRTPDFDKQAEADAFEKETVFMASDEIKAVEDEKCFSCGEEPCVKEALS
jgi:cell fate (sporulation/competence/biofilm development) regulator YmcA (YheA/YmcA/DUF963 family)